MGLNIFEKFFGKAEEIMDTVDGGDKKRKEEEIVAEAKTWIEAQVKDFFTTTIKRISSQEEAEKAALDMANKIYQRGLLDARSIVQEARKEIAA